MDSITLYKDGEFVTYSIEDIVKEYEEDWDNDKVYYKIYPDGKVVRVNIETWDIYEYEIIE